MTPYLVRKVDKPPRKTVQMHEFDNVEVQTIEGEASPYADEPVSDDVNFVNRETALAQKGKAHKKILPFVMQFQPALKGLNNILLHKWHLIQNQPNLREIFKEPPLISFRKGNRLKICLSKLNCSGYCGHTAGVALVRQTHFRHVFNCMSAVLCGLVKSSSFRCCKSNDNVCPCIRFFFLANAKLIHFFTHFPQFN